MFKPVVTQARRLDVLFDAWASAALDAQVSWEAWLASETRDRGDAYAGYRASLDREEHAAAVLAAAVGRRPDGPGLKAAA